jgi:hypothetical protein
MSRSALLNRLAQARRDIAMGEENTARLREIIARLESGGRDSSTAKELLARFEELQKLPIADRNRLEKELAACGTRPNHPRTPRLVRAG